MPQQDLRDLRRTLARRQQEKAELDLQVGAFESQLRAEVGPLQERLLRLQMERLKEAAQSQMRSARLRNAYHDARAAYERFSRRREDDGGERPLSKSELQATFRRASKECHPDAVPPAYRKEATATFRALETAYEGEHRPAVTAIADSLEKWGFPQNVENRGEQGERKAQIRDAVASLDASIEALKSSDSYQVVREAPTLEAAIDAQKQWLAEQLREMQRNDRRRTSRRR